VGSVWPCRRAGRTCARLLGAVSWFWRGTRRDKAHYDKILPCVRLRSELTTPTGATSGGLRSPFCSTRAARLSAGSTAGRSVLCGSSQQKVFFAPECCRFIHLVPVRSRRLATIIVHVAGPVLLAAGLWVRPVALLMLVLTLLAHTSGPLQD